MCFKISGVIGSFLLREWPIKRKAPSLTEITKFDLHGSGNPTYGIENIINLAI